LLGTCAGFKEGSLFAALQFIAGEDPYGVKQEKRGISSFWPAV